MVKMFLCAKHFLLIFLDLCFLILYNESAILKISKKAGAIHGFKI